MTMEHGLGKQEPFGDAPPPDKGKARAMEAETESEFEIEPKPTPVLVAVSGPSSSGRAKISRRPAGPWPPHLSSFHLAQLLRAMKEAADAYIAHQATARQPPFYAMPLNAPPPVPNSSGRAAQAQVQPPPLVLIRDERMRRRAHAEKTDLLWVEYCEARERYAQCVRAREMETLPDSVVYNLHRAFEDNIVQGPPFDGRRLGYVDQGRRRSRTDSIELS